ncbi:acylneuraminate cytidylyltransferase family protein [Flavobacterium sp.]|uniref:acylneuraminate cytidylyltransferase family protein n=1 Tax=Flavobacterium sp. TaxID=239 RepID=UPI00286A1EFC|nr:acylneuraminate cytidylyltransferase family protein [Flavobacterium sp.]
MRNIAIIPARRGSKRLPNKNTMSLGGLPLIAHSILEAKKHPAILDDIYVSTDDAQIKAVALSFGVKVIDRPAHLSGDAEPTVTALKHVLESIDFEVDSVFLLQPTNPLRPENLLADAFDLFQENQSESLMTVTRNHQKFGKLIDNQFVPFNYEIGQRSQDLEPLYFENGLLYIIKASLIMQEKIIGNKNFPMIVNHPFAHVDIDTQEDFDYAAYLLNHKL